MRKVLIVSLVFTLIGCATKTTPVQVAVVSHDALATAQDLEANLCFGVPDAYAALALPAHDHCTNPVAAQVGLTDAKHRQINQGLAEAFQFYRTATSVAQATGTADFSSMNAALQSVLTLLATLQQTNPTVTSLVTAVKSAKK